MLRALPVAVSLVVALLASAAGAQTLGYADKLAMYDATGKKLGDAHWVWDDPGYVSILFRAPSGRTLVLGAVRREFFGSSSVVWFTTGNCTGQAFLPEIISLYPVAAVIGPRQTVYGATVAAGYGRPRWINSQRGRDGACSSVRAERWTLPAAIELDLVDYFTPPFSLRGSGAAVPR